MLSQSSLTHSQRLKSWDSAENPAGPHRMTFNSDRIWYIVPAQQTVFRQFPAGWPYFISHDACTGSASGTCICMDRILFARIQSTVSLRFHAFSYFLSMCHAFPQSVGSWNCMFQNLVRSVNHPCSI